MLQPKSGLESRRLPLARVTQKWRISNHARFSRLFELHLHGGGNEIFTDVPNDENVFDIVQAVAIHVYARSKPGGSSEISYADVLGPRSLKYAALASRCVADTKWQQINPDGENCGFTPQDSARGEANPLRLDDAFMKFGAGIKTNRDAIAIGFDESSLLDAVYRFDSKWRSRKGAHKEIRPILYRPFDVRRIFYHEDLVASRSLPTMKHVIAGPNIGFICSSAWTTPDRFSVGVSRLMVEMKSGTHDRGTSFFPLYRYDALLDGKAKKVHNLRAKFVSDWKTKSRTKFVEIGQGDGESTTGPEDIFYWLFGLFYSPKYRHRHRSALAQRFPILLFPSNLKILWNLTRLGKQIAQAQLLESSGVETPITELVGNLNSEVEKISWSNKTVWIDKAQTRGFRGVREDVWKFYIGGYPVCEKWLKDRKGSTLSANDIAHYQKIVVAISETIRLMSEIDEVIEEHGGWPGAFISPEAEA